MKLRRHQFDPAIERAAGFGCIGTDRSEEADAGGAQPGLRDAIALRKLGRDGLGAAARQVEVVIEIALIVGVADDEDVELWLACEELRDLVERRAALRLDRRLVGVEIDAIERDVAG